MASACSRLQARVKNKCPLAHLIPSSAHSLNLIGECAVDSCKDAIDFFSLLQNLYNFFSIFTHLQNLKMYHWKNFKMVSQTWSMCDCMSLNKDWNEIILT